VNALLRNFIWENFTELRQVTWSFSLRQANFKGHFTKKLAFKKLYIVTSYRFENIFGEKPKIIMGGTLQWQCILWESYVMRGTKTRVGLLYVFFWVITRRLNFICRRFGTLCSIVIGKYVINYSPTCLWRWNSVFRNVGKWIQTPGNYHPKKRTTYRKRRKFEIKKIRPMFAPLICKLNDQKWSSEHEDIQNTFLLIQI
jgi:hypothetical protein